MLSSTGNDVEPGANGLGVSGGDPLIESSAGILGVHGGEGGNERPSSTRSSSATQHSNRSSSQDNDDPPSPSMVHGSTPLSQIGAHPSAPSNDMYLGQGNIIYLIFLFHLSSFPIVMKTTDKTFLEEFESVNTSDRIYLEEAGFWGLIALQQRENQYVDVGDANDEKYFG